MTLLERVRGEIDTLDAELLALLEQRAALVVRAAELKRAHGLPARDPQRERVIRERAASRVKRLTPTAARDFMAAVLAACLPPERVAAFPAEETRP